MNKEDTKKRQKGVRVNGNLSPNASIELERLCEKFDIGRYGVISTAVLYYAQKVRNEETPVAPTQSKPRESRTGSQLNDLKKTWCMEFGGSLESGLCLFDKYEVTLAGEVETSRRQVAIEDMPNEKEEMKKYMLGPYQNKYEAERALNKK